MLGEYKVEKQSFLSKLNIKQKIIALIILVSVLVAGISLFFTLKSINDGLLNANKNKIENIVDITEAILKSYEDQVNNGELTLKQAQHDAIVEVDKMKYEGENYIWLTDYNDNMLAHPKLQGKNISEVADINGIRFFHDGVVLAKEKGTGFIKYHWTKQGEDQSKVFPKISYFKAFPDWHWVIATGVYIDEINSTISRVFLQVILFNIIAIIGIIFAAIFTIVKDIVTSMKKITENLDESSKEIEVASSELQAASEKLAEGSTEQAASIQETSSTLEETSSMVQQNHNNTKQAASLAKQSMSSAEQSNNKMVNMMSAMEELKKSSAEISKIIKVIDEIAFQTNILSLNAAVEAARAGDAGKGFAVVAEEVRNLAQRSAEAAKETQIIIENNIKLSQDGSDIAAIVKGSISQIDEQSKKVSELLDEIAVATDEQTQGISQINKAVSQIETVINTNAQAAEESASSSKALFSQTLKMDEIISHLKAFVDGNLEISNKISSSKSIKSIVIQPKAVKAKPNKTAFVETKAAPRKAIPQKPIAKETDLKGMNPDDIIPLGDDMDNF